MRFKSFVLLALTLSSFYTLADPETYIRSYHYQASETDSKLTARSAAISQVHHLLLGELGTYINSRIDISKTSSGKGFSKQDISALTAGIIKTEILEETWDGSEYYVRAKVVADPDDIARKLSDPDFVQKQYKNTKEISATEIEYWKSIIMSENAEMFRSYLDKYPDGQFKDLALLKIKQINDRKVNSKLKAERQEIESKLIREALSAYGGQTSQFRNTLLLSKPGKVAVVARHDTKGGRIGSYKDKDEVTYLLGDILYKEINKVSPKGTEIVKITDFDETRSFLFDDQEGKESDKVCAQKKSDMVVAAILEDHEGTKGYLRNMTLSIFDCDTRELTRHTFLPDFNKSGRFQRETSIKKEFRVFVNDYIDSL